MPIVDIEENTKQMEFGFGDIEVASGLLKEDDVIGVVIFKEREIPALIGTKGVYEKHQEVEVGETPVRMVFHKIDSIDVVIRALEEAKQFMIRGSF